MDNNSKQRILNAAVKLFAKKGYDGTSIRQISKEADTNICMISYFWGGKKELYNGIIENLIQKQTEFAASFIDFNISPEKLSKQEQINLLFNILDKFILFFYSENISKDLIAFLLKVQHENEQWAVNSPAFIYLRKLIAAVFNKKETDRKIILRTVFILSQMNSPRILPAFSLSLLGQEDFIQDDIKIIKENVKLYINALLKEENIV